MIIARAVAQQLERSSWIRRMFEEGARLRRQLGDDKVFDFTLGNPEVEPPGVVLQTLRRMLESEPKGLHGYMPNLGFSDVRAAIAKRLAAETSVPFVADSICMTVGAAGACNVILKSILDPGDEVILLAPFFAEYPFYVANHGGRSIVVDTTDDFLPDVDRIAAAITPCTRAILINTPNNPSGRVYPRERLRELGAMLSALPEPPLVLSDEPYRNLLYDGATPSFVASEIPRTAVCYSWSKAQAVAGERIGYLALSPSIPEGATLMNACAFANRTLGFVNAPALWQRVMAEAGDACVDIAPYQRKRDLLCDGLRDAGYDVRKPEGGYYVFLKTPIPDDVAFVNTLVKHGILTVPGTGFGRPGYLRLTLTVPEDCIVRSLPSFAKALHG
jgi:aspartate aminotransferase